MHIELDHISPSFIEKNHWSDSQIWGKNILFKKNTYIQIVAPSGSGKTSLIHFLYGLRKDYNGSIKFSNNVLKVLGVESLSTYRQKNLSVIFQDLRLFKDKTAKANIEIKRQLTDYYPAIKIQEIAAELDIADKLHRTAGTCSYGEQQRIAIVRSLMQPFDFLLLDEPFSHLDERNKEKAFGVIDRECKLRNASMIFADLKFHEFFSNHITYQL